MRATTLSSGSLPPIPSNFGLIVVSLSLFYFAYVSRKHVRDGKLKTTKHAKPMHIEILPQYDLLGVVYRWCDGRSSCVVGGREALRVCSLGSLSHTHFFFSFSMCVCVSVSVCLCACVCV